MLQTLTKISNTKFKAFSPLFAAAFSSGKDKTPFPLNPLDLPEKQPLYVHKANYNQEQFSKYSKDLKEALETRAKEDDIELKIKSKELRPINRRNRRIYNRPRHDWNIENYTAWRAFDREISKLHPHSLPVVCKIALAPKYLVKAFGIGKEAYRNPHGTKEYDFEDCNLDLFILYDYRTTTKYWGDNKEGFDYENQNHIPPRKRIRQWPTVDEFWNSEEEYMFRVNCSDYADFRKFKKWVMTKVEEAKTSNASHDEAAVAKYGPLEAYNNYDAKYDMRTDMAVFKFTRDYFLQPGEKHDKVTKYHEKLTPAKKLDDKHKIDYGVDMP